MIYTPILTTTSLCLHNILMHRITQQGSITHLIEASAPERDQMYNDWSPRQSVNIYPNANHKCGVAHG